MPLREGYVLYTVLLEQLPCSPVLLWEKTFSLARGVVLCESKLLVLK
jgi:hypothetical protein